MATQKELEARIAQLEAQLADKGISAPASPPKASAKAPTILRQWQTCPRQGRNLRRFR